MSEKLNNETWVYTIIKDPGVTEQYLGQHEPETDISYLPIFREKEQATQGLLQLQVERGTRCEVQAVIYSDIARAAGDNGFLLYLLDETGNVLDKFTPAAKK